MVQSILNFLYSVMFAIASTFGINAGTEQPYYDVVERVSDSVEIRQYPVRIVAETTIDAAKSSNPRGDAFRIIAGYIFGANKGRQKIDMTAPVEVATTGTTIAMTAPVEVNSSGSALVMRFFLPAQYTMGELPEPTNPRVKLIEMPPTTVAALRFSGSTDDDAVQAMYEELVKALRATSWKVAGPPTAFFYNPPWTIPFLRTNEVIVSVAKQ
jgi:hypothetical protein